MAEHDRSVMMPVSADEFGQQIFLTLLNKLIDEQHQTNKALREMQSVLTSVVAEMAALKAGDNHAIRNHSSRIEKLEAEKQRRDGAASLAVWVKDFAPWIVAILFGLWVIFNKPG